jgi:hypothetical protein
MAVSRLDVIDLEHEVVRLINNEAEVGISKSLSGNGCATLVAVNRDLGFFDDTNGITEVGDFAKVVGVSDIFDDGRLTEGLLDLLGVDYRREVAVGQIAVTVCARKCHFEIPPIGIVLA